jgi:hypothetical protein
MRLSARNQLKATVDSVFLGAVMASVKVTLPAGRRGYALGDDVLALPIATLWTTQPTKTATANQFE